MPILHPKSMELPQWTSAVLVLVVSSAGFPTTEGSIEVELERAEQQLEQLTSRFVALSNKLDSAVEERRLKEMTTRRLTKSVDDHQRRRGPCEEYYFPCASGPDGGVQCIRDYLVCDRYKDCKNGADEAEDLCKVHFPTPVTFIGHLLRNDCQTLSGSAPKGEGKSGEWTIYETEITPWFPSRPKLPFMFSFGREDSILGFNSSGAMETMGIYDYASGDIFIPWDPNHQQIGWCKFDPVNSEKTAYRCELERSDFDFETKQETCYVNNWIWNK